MISLSMTTGINEDMTYGVTDGAAMVMKWQ